MILTKNTALSAMLLLAASLPIPANAATLAFSFSGPGTSGSVLLTYGSATDAKYPQAFEVTGISGTFTDTNNGLNLISVPIGALVPVKHDAPEPTNLLAPNDFSRFAVSSGLSPMNNGFLTYDNLLYPGGSPQTASDYPVSGGLFDIYGLMFQIGGGKVVNFWSNGKFPGSDQSDYGVAVATADLALDYVGGGVVVTPEPGSVVLLGSGLLGLLAWRRRATQQTSL